MLYPFVGIERRLEWQLRVAASAAQLMVIAVREEQMFVAEIQPAPILPAFRLSAAYVRKSAVYLLVASGLIAPRRDAIADVSPPVLVITNRPIHHALSVTNM
jgi:hypothetical protein